MRSVAAFGGRALPTDVQPPSSSADAADTVVRLVFVREGTPRVPCLRTLCQFKVAVFRAPAHFTRKRTHALRKFSHFPKYMRGVGGGSRVCTVAVCVCVCVWTNATRRSAGDIDGKSIGSMLVWPLYYGTRSNSAAAAATAGGGRCIGRMHRIEAYKTAQFMRA